MKHVYRRPRDLRPIRRRIQPPSAVAFLFRRRVSIYRRPRLMWRRLQPRVQMLSAVAFLFRPRAHLVTRRIYDLRRLKRRTAMPFVPQYSGLRVQYGGVTHGLSLVALADAPVAGSLRLVKGGQTLVPYLVATTDPNASPVRVQTASGLKAMRLMT